jgi:hypothetical protein
MALIIKPKVPFAGSVSKPPVQPGDVARPMAAAALALSATGQHVDKPEIKNMMTEGTFHLYQNIEKRDALDSMLAMLSCSITSASLDCLSQAALSDPKHLDIRDLNLRHGLKGAAMAIELVKALDSRRVAKSEKVTVGQVNVEAGGQAIVGNIETAPQAGGLPTKPSKAA